jgi:hypothetical protein
MPQQLERWGYTYNYVRPHQAFDYLTPAEYHEFWLEAKRPERHQSLGGVHLFAISLILGIQ